MLYKKSSGRNFTIYASKREAVCCEVQTHFGSFRFARFMNKVLGAFLRFLRRKAKLFAAKFRRILEVLCLQGLQRKFWTNIHDLRVSKRSCLPWSSDIFWKFSHYEVYEKSSGCIFMMSASKNEAVCCEVQTHFGIYLRASFIKKFLAHFHDVCVQKHNCLPWSSDAFWKFSACKDYRKSSGWYFTIYACKNEAICREVETHFGSSPLARFTEKVLGSISRFMRAKTKLFAV